MPEEVFSPKWLQPFGVLEAVEEVTAHHPWYLLSEPLQIASVWQRFCQELIQHWNPVEEVFTQGLQQDIEKSLALIPELPYLLRGPRRIETATMRGTVEIFSQL
ncbi:MAG: hypothetical protein QMD88_09125 [Coprothermobacterota bacterium]|nr:hypothetical protein [Coprothermobacterota bacterium]